MCLLAVSGWDSLPVCCGSLCLVFSNTYLPSTLLYLLCCIDTFVPYLLSSFLEFLPAFPLPALLDLFVVVGLFSPHIHITLGLPPTLLPPLYTLHLVPCPYYLLLWLPLCYYPCVFIACLPSQLPFMFLPLFLPICWFILCTLYCLVLHILPPSLLPITTT